MPDADPPSLPRRPPRPDGPLARAKEHEADAAFRAWLLVQPAGARAMAALALAFLGAIEAGFAMGNAREP